MGVLRHYAFNSLFEMHHLFNVDLWLWKIREAFNSLFEMLALGEGEVAALVEPFNSLFEMHG